MWLGPSGLQPLVSQLDSALGSRSTPASRPGARAPPRCHRRVVARDLPRAAAPDRALYDEPSVRAHHVYPALAGGAVGQDGAAVRQGRLHRLAADADDAAAGGVQAVPFEHRPRAPGAPLRGGNPRRPHQIPSRPRNGMSPASCPIPIPATGPLQFVQAESPGRFMPSGPRTALGFARRGETGVSKSVSCSASASGSALGTTACDFNAAAAGVAAALPHSLRPGSLLPPETAPPFGNPSRR